MRVGLQVSLSGGYNLCHPGAWLTHTHTHTHTHTEREREREKQTDTHRQL